MRHTYYILWIFLIMVMLSSCGKKLTPYTQRLSDDYGWTESDLKRIQFYVSQDIILRKVTTSGSSTIQDGKIIVKSGSDIDRIVIKQGTPGVLVFSPKEKRMAISFDLDDANYLMFGPNPKVANQYVILASEWEKRRAIVTYGGEKYRMEGSPFAKLLVNLKKVNNSKVKSKVAKGREI